MSDREPMTKAGYERLKDELHRLKTIERPAISKAIEEARAHGDLSENAEYHAAREKQGFIEGRIQELESKLALANVIDPKTLTGTRIVFGATVTLRDLETESDIRYQLVGVDEAEIKEGKISITAPIARSLVGKNEGDEITIHNPKTGERSYEVLKVEFL